jgi:hypothetical protein
MFNYCPTRRRSLLGTLHQCIGGKKEKSAGLHKSWAVEVGFSNEYDPFENTARDFPASIS